MNIPTPERSISFAFWREMPEIPKPDFGTTVNIPTPEQFTWFAFLPEILDFPKPDFLEAVNNPATTPRCYFGFSSIFNSILRLLRNPPGRDLTALLLPVPPTVPTRCGWNRAAGAIALFDIRSNLHESPITFRIVDKHAHI